MQAAASEFWDISHSFYPLLPHLGWRNQEISFSINDHMIGYVFVEWQKVSQSSR